MTSLCEQFLFMIISSMQGNITTYDCSAVTINSVYLSTLIFVSLTLYPSLSLSLCLMRIFKLRYGYYMHFVILCCLYILRYIILWNGICHPFQLHRTSGYTFSKITWKKILNNSLNFIHKYLKTHVSFNYIDISLNITFEIPYCSYSVIIRRVVELT